MRGLDKLVGLQSLKNMAKRDITASIFLHEQFPHTGLYGPGGLGKTAFAQAMAEELGYYFVHIEGSTVNTKPALVAQLIRADQRAKEHGRTLFFFVDECHRLGKLQEVLYFPLKEWYIITDNGNHSIFPFTMFAATTHPHMLMSSFSDRLIYKWNLHPYSISQIQRMVDNKFVEYGLRIPPRVSRLIAARSLGVPRLANNACLKIRNETVCRKVRQGGDSGVTVGDCERAFVMEGIDFVGLQREHRSYLRQLYNSMPQPKGVGSIAGKLGLDKDVVEGNIEPILLRLEFIDTTSKGRIITTAGVDHLKKCGFSEK